MAHDDQAEQGPPRDPSSPRTRSRRKTDRAIERQGDKKHEPGRAADGPAKAYPPKIDRIALIRPSPWAPGTKPPFFEAIPCRATVDGTDGIPVSAAPEVAAELLEQLQKHGEMAIHDCWNFIAQDGPNLPPDSYNPAAHPCDYVSIRIDPGNGRREKRGFSATRHIHQEIFGPPSPTEIEEAHRRFEAVTSILAKLAVDVWKRKQAEKKAAAAMATAPRDEPPRPSARPSCSTCKTPFATSTAKFCSECGARR